jgi:2-oxoglutarate dehydrogenase E2 component (dihydrolipoamide succinyltransferase)
MSIEVKVPALPESVADATVLVWHKKPGEFVNRDENLVDLETDKVVLEVPAPQSGVLSDVLFSQGTTVTSNQVLAIIQEGVAAAPVAPTAAAVQPVAAPAVTAAPAPMPSPAATSSVTMPASPVVRRLASEHDIDIQAVPGTGKEGRVVKQDIVNFMSSRPEKRVPMSRMRVTIAKRLVEAQHNAAMLTTFNEVNLQAVKELRETYRESFEKRHGVRLGFMSFFTKAAVEALKRFPAVNASIDGTDIVYHGYYDIGIAVSTERGLVVPIVRDADIKPMADIERSINDFGSRARDNKLNLDEMQGGTFTITNGGVFGSLMSTPILNPPQVAILGMHKIQDRPVVEKGQIVIRPMMYLALSYDHRVIDGKESVQFLVAIKELLEDPTRLLLNV